MTLSPLPAVERVAVLLLLGAVLAGCGHTVGMPGWPISPTTPGPPNQSAPPLQAGVDPMTALSQRPITMPVIADNAGCVGTSQRDLGNVVPNYGFGLGPLYLSGQNAWASDGQVAILMVDSRYSGPLLVRAMELGGAGQTTITLTDFAPTNYSLDAKERHGGVNVVPAVHTPAGGLFLDAVAPSSFWRAWFGMLSTSGPGCFGLQVDGDVFTEFIVFLVHAGKPPPG